MKKGLLRICSIALLCAVLSSCASDAPTVTDDNAVTQPPQTEAPAQPPEIPKIGTVWYTTPAIPASVGDTVQLCGYDVQLAYGTTVPNTEVNWTSSDLAIDENGCVKADKAGVFQLEAEHAGLKKSVYLIVKEQADTEYVLYYNDFENADINDFTVKKYGNATASIKDGKLLLSAGNSSSDSVRVIMPELLSQFGDYKITASVTMDKAADEKRWLSVMHRIQGGDYPYYQLCIRQNAALGDGVELAYRNKDSAWEYHGKTSGPEKLSPDRSYQLMLDIHGFYGAGYINGEKILETADGLCELAIGNIGFQASGSQTSFDDIKVVIEFYEAEDFVFPKRISDVRDIDTQIANPSAIISEIESGAELENILEYSPTVTIFTANSALDVLDKEGNVITTLQAAIDKLAERVIPAIRPTDEQATVAIAEFCKDNGYPEAIIVSDNSEYIKTARDKYYLLRGALDLSSEILTDEDLADIRTRTSESQSRICILPAAMATQSNTEYLYSLACTVWYKAEKNDKLELYTLLTSGANGIVTSDRVLLEKCMGTSVFVRDSLVRPINVIGHRGIPAYASENTLYGAILAARRGANIIENDIYITTDGVIAVMHDETLDRTTNGRGKVESMTYAQLSQYVVDQMGAAQPIPTLEDYFREFKGKDVNLFVEIKSQNKKIVPALKVLMEQYDIFDQCCVISFHTSMIDLTRKEIPQISCGYLTSPANVESILKSTGRFDCTFNPSYSGLTEQVMKDCSYRGVSIWPWTVNDKTDFIKLFKMGMWGITTNYANYVEDYIKFVTPENEYRIDANGSVDAGVDCITYSGKTITAENVTIEVIDGDGRVKYENGKLVAEKSGTCSVIFRVTYDLTSSDTVNVYSQPVTVHVG